MTILDGTSDYVSPVSGFVTPDGVRTLSDAEQIEHRMYARAAALQAATRLIATGHAKWGHRAPLELAEAFEEWLLRPVDAPATPGPEDEPPPGLYNQR